MKDLIIIGASGFGREVAWIVERINEKEKQWNLLGFLDDNQNLQGKTINNYKVLGKCEEALKYPNAYYVCAVAASKIREQIIQRLENVLPTVQYATIIDPSVIKSDLVEIGYGTIICPGTIITVNIRLGEHVIINYDCTIGHDAVLSDYVSLYPSVNISGNTHIGKCVELGTGTQIIQGKAIGDYSIIGAGAVIIKDIPKQCTAVGIPAVPIK